MDFAAIPATFVKVVVVAIAHLPILLVVLCSSPIWVLAALKPASHAGPALGLLRELRSWSADVVSGTAGGPARTSEARPGRRRTRAVQERESTGRGRGR